MEKHVQELQEKLIVKLIEQTKVQSRLIELLDAELKVYKSALETAKLSLQFYDSIEFSPTSALPEAEWVAKKTLKEISKVIG